MVPKTSKNGRFGAAVGRARAKKAKKVAFWGQKVSASGSRFMARRSAASDTPKGFMAEGKGGGKKFGGPKGRKKIFPWAGL